MAFRITPAALKYTTYVPTLRGGWIRGRAQVCNAQFCAAYVGIGSFCAVEPSQRASISGRSGPKPDVISISSGPWEIMVILSVTKEYDPCETTKTTR